MRRARRLLAGLAPLHLLAATLALQIVGVALVADAAQHDGWMWFQGGDQLWHWTGAWLISDGILPPAYVGWLWSFLLTPAAAVLGPNFVSAAPLFVLVQPLLLVPAATALAYAAGSRIGGRWFGATAAAVWAFAPFVATPLFVDRYHDRWVDQVLPQLSGLTGLSDLPTTAVVLGSMVATLRALDRPALFDGALAGALMGLALGLKPSSALFLAAPAAAFAAARVWRPAAAYAVAMLPFLLVLGLWKYRGLGSLPVFSDAAAHVAVGSRPVLGVNPVDRYLDLDWNHLDHNLDQLREFFWSARLLVWIAIAGTIGLFRLSLPKAVLVSFWFWPYVLAKGTAQLVTVESGSFWRHVMPALPAYALLITAIGLLVPGVAVRVRAAGTPAPRHLPRRALAIAGAVAFVVPLATIALLRPLDGPRAIQMFEEGTLVPVVGDLRIDAVRTGDRLQLSWSAPETGRSQPFYRLFRSSGDDLECFDLGVRQCVLHGEPMDTVEDPAQTVPFEPGSYRIGMVVDARRQVGEGETLLLGPPLVVRR